MVGDCLVRGSAGGSGRTVPGCACLLRAGATQPINRLGRKRFGQRAFLAPRGGAQPNPSAGTPGPETGPDGRLSASSRLQKGRRFRRILSGADAGRNKVVEG